MRVIGLMPARASLVWLAPVLIFAAAGRPMPPAADPTIENDSRLSCFAVTNLDPKALANFAAKRPSSTDWHGLFFVAVAGAPDALVPMLGEYTVANGLLLFTPRFPLRSGEFVAKLNPSRLTNDGTIAVEKRFSFSHKPDGPPATVRQVYPTADTLPENLLKFYIHFTGPMRRGEAYEHLRLLDAKGNVIERSFLELGEELWDRSGQRFTLLIDPGRIKQGLKPREDLGPVLEAGKGYTLVIDGRWKDAEGRPLGRDYKKNFRASAAIEQPIEPADWKLSPPPAGTRAPLTVTFPRPLDHALLLRVVYVMDAAGREVEGEIAVTEHEMRWQFIPRNAWTAGQYNLEVEQILEDLAGNSVGRTFEVDEERPAPVLQKRTRRPFAVAAKQ
jgi:hypothetical protein